MQNSNSSNSLEIISTSDGSQTLFNPFVGENYHSINGALQESQHVFVQNGLHFYNQHTKKNNLKILEIGFGTGLNFILSLDFALKNKITLNYVGIEAFPLSLDLIEKLNYKAFVDAATWKVYSEKYEASFEKEQNLWNDSSLRIIHSNLLDTELNEKFDIVYFDAFAKSYQAEMWTEESIKYACTFLKDKGIFVTYSVTGELKRILKSIGFEIERPQGAAGKREMMRATLNHAI